MENLLDERGELGVLLARLQEADDRLRRNLGGLEGIGLAAGDLLLPDHDGRGHERHVAINVRAQIAANFALAGETQGRIEKRRKVQSVRETRAIHFGDVPFLEVDAVLFQWRKVSAAVVDRNAGWKRNSFFHLLTLINFCKGLVDFIVSESAELGNRLSFLARSYNNLDRLCEQVQIRSGVNNRRRTTC